MTTARRSTDLPGITHTVRLSCDCATCRTNADLIGKPFPLVAWVTDGYAAALKITERNANSPRKVHTTVELANHPVLGPAQRAALAE